MSSGILRSHVNRNKLRAHHPPAKEWFKDVDENLVSAVVFHAVTAGTYLALCSNRALTGVKLTIALGDEKIEEWANDAEKMNELLAEYNGILVELCIEKGHLPSPPNA